MKLRKLIIATGLAALMVVPSIAGAEGKAVSQKSAEIIVEDLSEEEFLKEERESLSIFNDEFLEKQEEAAVKYDKLIEAYEEQAVATDEYPEYYGGSYINDEGNLVVYVKEEAATRTSVSRNISRTVESNDFIVKAAKYSYNELDDIMDTLNEYKDKNPDSDVAQNFNLFYMADIENCIVVELDDMSEEQIQKFKEQVIDTPIIEFRQSEGILDTEANVNPGQKISKSGSNASMGYRAKKNGEVGIVTAAHFGTSNATVNVNGTTIGKVTSRKYSGTVDAAFVKITNSNYKPTNTINGTSNTISTKTSKPGAGTVINKRGFKTGHTSGKVVSTNATATFTSGVTLKNLTSTSYSSDSGDSGGIVYSYVSSSNTRYTLGIHCGGNSKTKYYVKADEINSALGLSRY